MNLRFCDVCRRARVFRRHYGAVTIVAIILTYGLWFLVLPFYQPRCGACYALQPVTVTQSAPWTRSEALRFCAFLLVIALPITLVGR